MQLDIKPIRYDEANKNVEAIKGNYAQRGEKSYAVTIIKNTMFIVLYNGAKVSDVRLPTIYDGFLMTNKGRRIQVTNSTLNVSLAADENAQGTFMLQKWN